MKKTILSFSIFIVTLYFIGCREKLAETKNDKVVEVSVETADYEIVNIEDQSRKALGKNLSQYEISELEKLPTNKKILYKIVLSKDIKENQVKPTVEKIISKLTTEDSDIDEIILWLYSDKELLNSSYDIGTAIWAPFGKLGNINANIAKNNNRDNYLIVYQIKNNLDQYLNLKLETNDKFGFTVDERKQIFKDLVKAEDNAFEYKQSEQDKMLKQNKTKLLKKYNITAEQLKEISDEGLDKYWPMD